MHAGDLECLIQELESREAALEASLLASASIMAGADGLPPDLVDRAALEADRNFAVLLRERDRQALRSIEEALDRVRSGEYGLCLDCGEAIDPARLRAQPTATLCVPCRQVREEEERRASWLVSNVL